ncbi:carbohydrate ABC transporter permease [Vallitalea okinawensis]|uniref:carbohydrate ABC transporter permease n=1 Tax=Vallitalea okinawensis TaxID=2078660 RepID=UPI000CFB2E95|nr:carbohydrate ABC transporter permease [Vallitalea okinawensis]
MKRRIKTMDVAIYLIIGVFSLICLYPFLMVIGGSLSTQKEIYEHGYRIFPSEVTLGSYKALLMNYKSILNGYTITVIVTISGTLLALGVNAMMAYVLSSKQIKYSRFLNVFTLITIMFNGGMVPWYIVCVNYLHLKDTLWALILPMVANGWNIFLMRNFFSAIPYEMYEAARIDGARAFKIFRTIYLPLSKPVLATVGLFTSLAYWNDWWHGMMLVDKAELQPLQLLLRNIISNVQFLKTMNPSPEMQSLVGSLPSEGIRMAMVIITIGPIILVYPFLQKYFVKGIMVGAVKG